MWRSFFGFMGLNSEEGLSQGEDDGQSECDCERGFAKTLLKRRPRRPGALGARPDSIWGSGFRGSDLGFEVGRGEFGRISRLGGGEESRRTDAGLGRVS